MITKFAIAASFDLRIGFGLARLAARSAPPARAREKSDHRAAAASGDVSALAPAERVGVELARALGDPLPRAGALGLAQAVSRHPRELARVLQGLSQLALESVGVDGSHEQARPAVLDRLGAPAPVPGQTRTAVGLRWVQTACR